MAHFEDFDGKNECQEPETDDKKQDKFNDYDDHFLKNHLAFTILGPGGLLNNRNTFFSSDGYSRVIYSPPDLL